MKVVFVDRDGVINDLVARNGGKFSPLQTSDFTLLPGALKALQRLVDTGYSVVVVTNQPDVGRGLINMTELAEMHKSLPVGLSDILICPHDAHAQCTCRKPKPGLLHSYLLRVKDPVTEIWMIGDRESDLLAGRAAGAKTIWISTGQQSKLVIPALADFSVESLCQAARVILNCVAQSSAQSQTANGKDPLILNVAEPES